MSQADLLLSVTCRLPQSTFHLPKFANNPVEGELPDWEAVAPKWDKAG
jgi:hypothetical protein